MFGWKPTPVSESHPRGFDSFFQLNKINWTILKSIKRKTGMFIAYSLGCVLLYRLLDQKRDALD